MRDRTCKYVEAVASAKKAQKLKKKELLQRLQMYKSCNAYRQSTETTHNIVSISYAMINNYLEQRVCKYQYFIACHTCCREVYICGVNCKLCGSWECTQCITAYCGIGLCKECKHTISSSPSAKSSEYSLETQEYYTILRSCLKKPSNENIKQLSDLLRQLESNTSTNAMTEERIKKNLLVRAKIALCDWYIYKAKEERYTMLFEQLEYLEVLKKQNIFYSVPIDSAIKEILEEIASSGSFSNFSKKV